MDKIKNEKATAEVEQFVDKVREVKMRWFGHMQIMDGYGPARQEEKRTTTEELHRCNTEGHAEAVDSRDGVQLRQLVCCGKI